MIVIRILLLLFLCLQLQPSASAANPPPTHADVSFGPHPHQLLDIHLPADQAGPFPVLVWYGGLWKPAKHAPDVNRFFQHGIAVVAVQVRTMTDASEDKVSDPVSYVQLDAVRSVQFLRANAEKFNLDTTKIVTGGGSQGALPALYVGTSGEHANPKSDDPVERESSLITAVAAYRCQPTIDPKRMQEWVPGVKWGAPALGCLFEESLERRDELLPVIKKWSPDWLLHKDAAPMYFENEWGMTKPEDITQVNYNVHSPAWALGFQKLAHEAGAICHVKNPDHPTDAAENIWEFIIQTLRQN